MLLNLCLLIAFCAFIWNVQILDEVPLMPSSSGQVVNSMATRRNKEAWMELTNELVTTGSTYWYCGFPRELLVRICGDLLWRCGRVRTSCSAMSSPSDCSVSLFAALPSFAGCGSSDGPLVLDSRLSLKVSPGLETLALKPLLQLASLPQSPHYRNLLLLLLSSAIHFPIKTKVVSLLLFSGVVCQIPGSGHLTLERHKAVVNSDEALSCGHPHSQA